VVHSSGSGEGGILIIEKLASAVGRFPAIRVITAWDGDEGQATEGGWAVCFEVEHSEAGWRSLEFLAWIKRDLFRGGWAVSLQADSVPPYLNVPGRTLCFRFAGSGDADWVADFMERMRKESYVAVDPENEEALQSYFETRKADLIQRLSEGDVEPDEER
jgi:hypothetical protein